MLMIVGTLLHEFVHLWKFGGIEVGRIHDPHLDVAVVRALDGAVLDFAEVPLANEGLVEVVERSHLGDFLAINRERRRCVEHI